MVSVIVPIYNVSLFLEKCVDSILKQSYSDLQILLVDDGSTDESGAICDRYALCDSRVQVIHQSNVGLSGARNTGINNAVGEWITIVDGDDWLDSDAVERMLYAASKEPDCDVFIASFYADYQNKEYPDSFFKQDRIIFNQSNMKLLQMSCLCRTQISKDNSAMNVGVTWARLYRTEFIKHKELQFKVGLKRMQDAVFHLTAFEYAKKVCFINMPVYHYRIWNGSATQKYTKDFEITAREIVSEIHNYITCFLPGDTFERCYYTKGVLLLAEIIKLTYAPCENLMPRKKKVQEIKRIMKQDFYKRALKKADILMLSRKGRVIYILLRLHMVNLVLYLYERRAAYMSRKMSIYAKA